MKLRFLFGTLAAIALLGAGCSRTITPTSAPTASQEQSAGVVVGTTPQAEAPALSAELEPLPPSSEPPTPPPPLEKPKDIPATEKTSAVAPIITPKEAPSPVSAPAPKLTTHAVTIKGFAFGPTALTVKVGDTVVWTQEDSVTHNVVADDGSSSGPLLSKGQTYTKTFTEKGTFAYHCAPHPFMKATVVVE